MALTGLRVQKIKLQGPTCKKNRSGRMGIFSPSGGVPLAADRWDPVATLAAELANLAMPIT
jgi:hypothetical protein